MKHFKSPGKTFRDLDAGTVGQLVSASSDLALVMDKDGVIRDLALDNSEFAEYGCSAWVGQAWVETVTIESRDKVSQMLDAALSDGASSWRQVNHQGEAVSDLPVRYSAIRLPPTDRILAIGRDMRPESRLQQRLVEFQAQMEREYSRLRQTETRYQTLFQLTSEAIVILDASGRKVVEANPRAAKLLSPDGGDLAGEQIEQLFDETSFRDIGSLLTHLRTAPRADDITVCSAYSGLVFSLSASLFRLDMTLHFLLRLRPEDEMAIANGSSHLSGALSHVITNMPDGFVVIGDDRRILKANAAFLEMAQLAEEGQAIDASVERWLGRVGLEVDILLKTLRANGFIRRFGTAIRGEFGRIEDVEISGVAVLDARPPCFGLAIRKTEIKPEAVPSRNRTGIRSLDQLKDLVGRVPLRDLVKETTDIIEQMCIEAALELTGDNRASAAEMLGLSRQSLYVKLRRHGLGELDGDEQG